MAKKRSEGASSIARLRQRLREAEDTLAAIRDGHVEALVVKTSHGEQVFTLKNVDHPFRLMVEKMREGALTLSADGVILYCNDRFAELVAVRPERVVGRPLTEFVHPDDRARVDAMLQEPTSREEVPLRTADGALNPTQLSSTALHIDGIRTVAMIVTDLTPERTERGLRESNRLKDEFLATLSHELRTPLNVILGWTRMLLTDHLPESARRRALEIIDRNAQAQAQLVNDLVDMSRMTTGKVRLDLELVPIVPALESAIESVRPSASAKQLRIARIWAAADTSILADSTRLQQIFWNLLSNAVKFTPDGGCISVSTALLPDGVRIEIADTGIGILPAFLPHVFGRFRQADSGVTRSHGGLGLGLAIAHDLVHLHGGDIHVMSAGAGMGTTVSMTFRTGPAALAQGARDEQAGVRLYGYTVMLVEDHEDSRELIARALRRAGATVIGFGRAAEAFERLTEIQPTVIVADIGMPDESGHSFIRRIRSHESRGIRAVPAIAVSAYATAADRAESLAAGFQEHLSKPIEPVRVAAAVQAVAGHQRTG